MELSNKTPSEILLSAAELLEQDGKWMQRGFFKPDASGKCLMCAHGAIAFCGSPKIKEKILKNDLAGAVKELTSVLLNIDTLPPPNQIKEIVLAHYKAFKTGLSMTYNDNPNTTKQDVINKLREAAVT